MIEIVLNENGSVSNREIFIGFTGENLDKTLHFTYPEKYQSYHKYILVNHSVDDTFGVLPIVDDKFVVSTYLTSKKYGWELQVMFTEDELDLSAETVDLSPKEGKHQKLFKKIWCGIDRGLYSGEAINAFEEDENVKIFYDKIVAMINNGGTSGGVSSWNDLTDKPFYEDVENNVIVPMDKKFLPEHQHSWENLEDKPFYNYEEVLFEADSVTSEYHTWEMGTYKFIPLLDFKLGETIFVNLDGTTYEKTVVEVVEQGTGTTYIGLDFTSDFKLSQCGIFSDNLNIDLENAYVKIYRKHLKQIDEKVIPDSIARTKDIPTVPTTLPNPNALTFTGAVEETYDGSEAKTIDIPMGGGMSVSYDEEKEAIIFGASSGSSSEGNDEPYELIANIEITEDGVTSITQDLGNFYKKLLLTSVDILNPSSAYTVDVSTIITTSGGIVISGVNTEYITGTYIGELIKANFSSLNASANRMYFYELELLNGIWKAQATQQIASGGSQFGSSGQLLRGFSTSRNATDYLNKIEIIGTFANGCKLHLFGIKA